MASALTCGCADTPGRDDFDYYATKYTLSESPTEQSSTDNSTVESAILNVPYRNVTPLFRAIEREKWENILMFLNTGKWSSSFFSTVNEHMRSPSPTLQCKTWVTSYDRKGKPEWSQLPLHAAISYMAPFAVVQRLIELYPKAVQCTDNEGMLPIHLAFGFGAPDNVLALLMDIFPASINQRAIGGRLPAECCELGPSKIRGKIYSHITEQTVKRVKAEIDRDWRAYAMEAQKSVGIDEPTELGSMKLSQLLFDLLSDRKELQDMKRIAHTFQQSAMKAPAGQSSLKILDIASAKKKAASSASLQGPDASSLASSAVVSGAKAGGVGTPKLKAPSHVDTSYNGGNSSSKRDIKKEDDNNNAAVMSPASTKSQVTSLSKQAKARPTPIENTNNNNNSSSNNNNSKSNEKQQETVLESHAPQQQQKRRGVRLGWLKKFTHGTADGDLDQA